MPLFSFLEFQDINLTSAEQSGDLRKLNPSLRWHRPGISSCPGGVGVLTRSQEVAWWCTESTGGHSGRDQVCVPFQLFIP